tara:strand:- start:7356 stop:7793 length:438 start_codon:yes stop_codon:yes gene_type:complete
MSEIATPTQLIRLAKKFPDKLVSQIDKGTHKEDYVNHAVIAQRLLQVVGPYSWHCKTLESEGVVVAMKGQLTLEVDGKLIKVEGTGTDQGNKNKTIGEKIKEMESDAFKRAASKVGVGLHLWAQDQYFLNQQLSKDYGIDLNEVS